MVERRLKDTLEFNIPLNNPPNDVVNKITGTLTSLTYTDGPFGNSVGVFDGSDSKVDM